MLFRSQLMMQRVRLFRLLARQQRLALPGDPKCVICGRYGEYICDICSLECKNTLPGRNFGCHQQGQFSSLAAIPAVLSGKSLLASAHTGSVKTASFLINRRKKPLAIVLITPTRELCKQVQDQAKLPGRGLPFKTALIVCGDPMCGVIHCLHHQGVEPIVATLGRLIDLLAKHDIELQDATMFVVDEVYCMLQRGVSRSGPADFSQSGSTPVLDVLNKPSMAVKQVAIWVETKHRRSRSFRQVIVFDMLNAIREYVHMIGRACRMGQEGNAIMFAHTTKRV